MKLHNNTELNDLCRIFRMCHKVLWTGKTCQRFSKGSVHSAPRTQDSAKKTKSARKTIITLGMGVRSHHVEFRCLELMKGDSAPAIAARE
jgi:hypothetical protein